MVNNEDMVKITQNCEGCIGCGTCAALCPKFWEMNYDEAKAVLKGGSKNKETGEYELEVSDIECNKDAAEACPVQVIRVE